MFAWKDPDPLPANEQFTLLKLEIGFLEQVLMNRLLSQGVPNTTVHVVDSWLYAVGSICPSLSVGNNNIT
jgi:hypothetical protein